MSLIPLANAPTADDAENELGRLRDRVFVGLRTVRPEKTWQLALHGLSDEVEDIIVVIRRLATHERVWRESMGTRPEEPPHSDNPNHNTMQQMARGRADLRAFLLLVDVLLDNTVKALRLLGAPKKPTESLSALAHHLENGGAEWSKPLLPLAPELNGLQYSLGYFRDKFVVHRDLHPVTAMYLPDGKIRLSLLRGTKGYDDLARGGREVAALLPVPDAALDEMYDVRLDLAFAALRRAEPDVRSKLKAVLNEFGAVSPDPYEAALEVAETLEKLLLTAVEPTCDL